MRKTHLVGSVPLADSASVMRALGTTLGPFLDRIPDGETGKRLNWLGWQRAWIAACPALLPSDTPDHYGRRSRFRLAPGASDEDLAFGPLGYGDEAIASYAVFTQLLAAGHLPKHARFQVSLPTPLAITAAYIEPASQEAVEPNIEAALMADLDVILAGINAKQLAIQWDVAIEFAILHAGLPVWFADQEASIVERLGRLARSVPLAADVGFHLCFGDSGHKHFTEPESLAPLVSMANQTAAVAGRPIGWFHMPVPRGRDDAAYFAPLSNYAAAADLFLGLVHLTDGFAGAARRVAAARAFSDDFGVATECGFGRRPPDSVTALLALHREVCEQL